MRELLSTHQGERAKTQKAKTTPFLYFPGKDVPNLVLNKKDAEFSEKAHIFFSKRTVHTMSVDV